MHRQRIVELVPSLRLVGVSLFHGPLPMT